MKLGGNDDEEEDKDGGFRKIIIEIDETYLGGKATNKHIDKRIVAKGVFKKDINSQGLYVIDRNIHANNIEGFWVALKCGIYVIYHQNGLRITLMSFALG
ncbi:MAG: hypothetical protein P857_745 [Candidatus Xenolissoclinum pacificiensis L6]|uniref:Transposase n=1 Tax=Candidatus Xenolissoclinum pacificiensis L6 TaxID=1401685 RepID=W2UYS1_9RICK|nr:MAG: hypothetical protein P857_745 [Candidatus Xenolissoclinum pacificiensis L6]